MKYQRYRTDSIINVPILFIMESLQPPKIRSPKISSSLEINQIFIWRGAEIIFYTFARARSLSFSDVSILQTIPKSVIAINLKLIKNLGKEKPGENLLFSALGAYSALMMLHLGASNATREELDKVFRIKDKDIE